MSKTKAARRAESDPPSPAAVTAYIGAVTKAKAANSETNKGLTVLTKRAADQGVNVPAARLAQRVYAKALSDPVAGRALLEDLNLYLKLMGFDRPAPRQNRTAAGLAAQLKEAARDQELAVQLETVGH
jgi:hypothetical protein